MNLFGYSSWPGWAKLIIEQEMQWERDVISVCCVYPHKVKVSAMSRALRDLDMSPGWAYCKLCEGSRIPRLDEALGVSA